MASLSFLHHVGSVWWVWVVSGFVSIWKSGEGEREGKCEGKIFFFLASARVGEEEDAQCRSKQHRFVLFLLFFLEKR
jgi:hypothetical protein